RSTSIAKFRAEESTSPIPSKPPLKYRLQNRLHGGTFLFVGHGLFVLSLFSENTIRIAMTRLFSRPQIPQGNHKPFYLNLQTIRYTPSKRTIRMQ
ncbi:MAG: hypothetical protein PHG30_06160, partial [Eubacteriales bacterium]|nr:hypothetical protein [Eubacteriales bacterium]